MKNINNKNLKLIVDNIKNYGPSIVAVLSFLGVVSINVLKLIEFTTAEIYFQYYGLSHNLYDYADKNFVLSFCMALIFLFAYSITFFLYKNLFKNLSSKKIFYFSNLESILLIIFLNVTVEMVLSSYTISSSFLINIVAITLDELVISYAIYNRKNKDQKKNNNLGYYKILKLIIWVTVILLFSQIYGVYSGLDNVKKYRVIDNSKVIVYTSKDYYLTLNCDIENENIVIYKGTQEKIDTINVETELKIFENVTMK